MVDSILKKFVRGARRTRGWFGEQFAFCRRCAAIAALFLWTLVPPTLASLSRTQVIELKQGWNAVFLEVQPSNSSPAEIFRGLPVQAAACFVSGHLQEQYLRTPGDAPWKEEGWVIWYEPSSPEAFLSDLHALQPHCAYLIKASAPFTWRVTGAASVRPIEWYPNTCTLTGLPIDPENAPTFAGFFAGSEAHRRMRIFRLEDTGWKLVREPASARPRSGEAFWIQTDGASTYQGPLKVKTVSTGEINFEWLSARKSVELINEGTSTAQIQIESISASEALPLSTVATDLSQRTTQLRKLPQVLTIPDISAGATTSLRLALDRTALQVNDAACLLRIRDGRGTEQWLPVKARQTSTKP